MANDKDRWRFYASRNGLSLGFHPSQLPEIPPALRAQSRLAIITPIKPIWLLMSGENLGGRYAQAENPLSLEIRKARAENRRA